jgi:hypothetical protein
MNLVRNWTFLDYKFHWDSYVGFTSYIWNSSPLLFTTTALHILFKKSYPSNNGCRDNVVPIATGYGLYDRGGLSSNPCKVTNFLFSAPGWRLFPRWVKRPGCEGDHPLSTSAEVKKTIPPYILRWRLFPLWVKQQGGGGGEGDNPPPTSAKVKKTFPPIHLHDVVLN